MTFPVTYRPRSMCSLSMTQGGRASFSACSPFDAVERLQVARTDYHEPVMATEIVARFAPFTSGVIIDATLGGGGHAALLLAANPGLRLIGIDRDPEARAQAGTVLAPFAGRFRIVAATFAEIASVVAEAQDFIDGAPVVGVLMDLGVSSHQLDEPTRGFTFRADAPLDMRMNPTTGVTAAQYIETADVHEFTKLLRANGEDRFAGAIARSVIAARPHTTMELTAAVEKAVPMAARRKGHVATRVFQALRIAVNDEERQLEEGLAGALSVLSPDGVLAVLSYHSGEDKVVKATFHEWSTGGCRCSYELGCVCGATPLATVERASSQLATDHEIAANARARSARLRVARKVAS